MATTSSKVLILFLAIILVFGQDNPKCLEDQVTWFFNHVNKNPGALLDKRLQSRVIPLDPYPFNIGLILSLSCHTRQRSSDTNTTEEEATLGRNLGRYVVTQNVESKELVIFCHLPAAQLDTAERPKMMDEENWDPNEIRNRRMPVVLDVKQSNSSLSTTSTTTEEAIKDTTSTASDKTIDSLYHSPGHVRVDQNEHSEHVHHRHQQLDSWMDYKAAFWFTLFLWLFSMLTLLTAWLTKSKCKESQGGDGRGSRRRPNINEEEPAEEKDEALPALLSVSSSEQLNETVIHKKEDGNCSVIAVKTTPKSEKHHPDFYNHTPIAMSPHRLSSSHSPA